MERWEFGGWKDQYKVDDDEWGLCLNSVILEEYEDRYVEKYPVWEAYDCTILDEWGIERDVVRYNIIEMESRTIWKKDLWKNELHTIPYRPIHLEMLYSPDLPLFFQNEVKKARDHFDALVKRQ